MGRTSIPCSDRTRDILADEKPANTTWDQYLRHLADDKPIEQAETDELADEIHRLRREFDEFTSDVNRTLEGLRGRH